MRQLTRTEFIKKAKAFHGTRYTYAKTAYTTNKAKVKIGCRTHGIFEQRAAEHLIGCGCPKCAEIHTTSIDERAWLDTKRIAKRNRQIRLTVKGKRLTVDAYIPRSKTIYEFYGDMWHGNPTVYAATEENPVSGVPFGDLYQATIARERFLKRNGYKVVSIWENDWKGQTR
jgi:hypothetical protein